MAPESGKNNRNLTDERICILRTHPNNKYGLGLKYRGSANYTNKTCSRKASDERMFEAGERASEREEKNKRDDVRI